MPWNSQDPAAVGHDDVLALPDDLKPGPFERPHSPKVRDPGYLRHVLDGDLDFPQILPAGQLSGDFEVFANRVPDVRQSFFLSGALRPAPGETGAGDTVALFGWRQSNWVLHVSHSSTAEPNPLPLLHGPQS